MSINDIEWHAPHPDGYTPVTLQTTRGDIDCRYYPAGSADSSHAVHYAALFVGGAGGGFDTPVRGFLYPRLCEELSQEDHIPCLRLRYRRAADLAESTLDVLAGIAFLESEDADAVALTGHSFGGAVVIQAASMSPLVRTCVPLSTQSYGADPASTLGPRCSIFLAHGSDDEILPAACSELVYEMAKGPKHLELCPGATHGLDQTADYLPQMIREWIRTELTKPIHHSELQALWH
jgi:dienelactone hydrolase